MSDPPIDPDASEEPTPSLRKKPTEPRRLWRVLDGGSPPPVDPPPPPPEPPIQPRMKVLIRPDEHLVRDETIAALGGFAPNIYQRCNELIHVLTPTRPEHLLDDDPLQLQVAPIEKGLLRSVLTEVCEFYRIKDDEEVQDHPPDWLVQSVAQHRHWPGIRHLEGVSNCPAIRQDGTILDTEGYDVATGLIYLRDRRVQKEFDFVSTNVSKEQARAAAEELLDLVCDVPFASEVYRSAWLAAALTPFARRLYGGNAPLFLIDKNTPGTGGTLLADVIGVLATGQQMPRTANTHDDDEMRKRLVSMALTAKSIMLIDNVVGELGTPSLDMALTASNLDDRKLGKNAMLSVKLRLAWYATCNNAQLRQDTTRRCLHIRIQTPEERPQDRTDFRYPDLLKHTARHRHRLVPAALRVLLGFVAANRPKQAVKPWGSYQSWLETVVYALVWLGYADPTKGNEDLAEQASPEKDALVELLIAWQLWSPKDHRTVGDLLDDLEKEEVESRRHGTIPKWRRLRRAIEQFTGCKPGQLPSPKSLSAKLGAIVGRTCGGLALMRDKQRTENGLTYYIERVTDAAPPTPTADPARRATYVRERPQAEDEPF